MYRRLMTALILIPWLMPWLATPRPVLAAGIAVTTTVDETVVNGNCSLREAIQAVNTAQKVDECDGRSGTKEILLQAGATYNLTQPAGTPDSPDHGDLDILTGIALVGVPGNRPVIDASALGGDRALHIKSSLPVNLYSVVIRGGTVSEPNRGGGIYVEVGDVHLHSVAVHSNRASFGGGIYVASGASLTVNNGLIYENRAVQGGGVYASGSLSMFSSSLMDNSVASSLSFSALGAGLVNNAQGGSYARLVNSTVARNSNLDGPNRPAGIYSAARLVLENVTILDNQGFGLQFTSAFSSVVKNTIIARQIGLNCALPDGGSVILSGRHNLSDDASCQLNPLIDVELDSTAPNWISDNPEDFGVQTLMYGLLAGSPAIAMGADCQGFDQRGLARKTLCDIGSVEHDGTYPLFTWLPLISR